ncbi:VirK/YbjX family protein [Vibrio sp.]|uniref:VirK/YbjX family protein n=1 Tax=Vibrio sp. TaxID=678 RepID=UPI003D09FD4D
MRLQTLYQVSSKVYGSTNRFSVYRNRCRFCFRYLVTPRAAKTVNSMLQDSNISELFNLRPKMYDQPTHTYVCVGWNKETRLRNLAAHFSFMSKELGSKCMEIYSEQGYKLFSIQGNNDDEYDVRLCRGEWREGSLGLAITNKQAKIIYFTTFCVTESRELFIGCVQGAKADAEERSATIKSLTKAQHGMRPKALIVELTLMFARHFGLENAYCVSNKGHVYSAFGYQSKKRRKKVFFDYDAFCTELNGVKQNQYKFKLPLESIRRDLNELNRTKRKMYRKRYEMLDKYQEQMTASLSI